MRSLDPMAEAVVRGQPDEGLRREERPLHVALALASLGPGGAEHAACALSRRWVQSGHRVTLITIWPTSVDVLEAPAGVRRIALDCGRPSRNIVDGVLQATRRVLALRGAFLQLRADVVVSFLERINVASLLAASGLGLPVLVCERSDPRRHLIEGHYALLRRLLYPRAAGVVAQTESVAAWARAFCPRVHVIPNFVEPPTRSAHPGVDRGPKTLIGMGRLSKEKGFDQLIEAFGECAEFHPDWSLTILGEGAERKRLEALVLELGLSGRVSLPGRTDDPEAHLASAHAFALPSRYEGFPNALLEAMACGLPPVAFDCQSGPSEIITHERDGLLVPPGDVHAFARSLKRVMGSADERVRMGANARDIANRLAPERVLERWSALLRTVSPDDTMTTASCERADRTP